MGDRNEHIDFKTVNQTSERQNEQLTLSPDTFSMAVGVKDAYHQAIQESRSKMLECTAKVHQTPDTPLFASDAPETPAF